MKRGIRTGALGLLVGSATVLSLASVGVSAASAATDACGPGTAVSGAPAGVCELTLFYVADKPAELPSGITKLSAVLIGGGGAGYWGDFPGGGGAGEVIHANLVLPNIPTTAPLALNSAIGAGGMVDERYIEGESGGNTTLELGGLTWTIGSGTSPMNGPVSASGGTSGYNSGGGNSGSGNEGTQHGDSSEDSLFGGGGDGGAAPLEGGAGGPGYINFAGLLAQHPANSANNALWVGDLPGFAEVAAGGPGLDSLYLGESMGPGSGGLGYVWDVEGVTAEDMNGHNGLVVIRYEMAGQTPAPAPSGNDDQERIAETGIAGDAGSVIAAGAATLLAGAALITVARRRHLNQV